MADETKAPERGPHLSMKAWGVTAAATAGYALLSVLPLPGVDGEVLDAQLDSPYYDGSSAPIALSVLGVAASWLLIVRGGLVVLGAFTKHGRTARPYVFAGYLAFAALQAYGIALWLESLNTLSPFGDAVANPGWGFRLTVIAIMTASAALLWILATVVTRYGVGHGPLVFFGLSTIVRVWTLAGAQAESIVFGASAPIDAIATLLWAAPAVVVAIVLFRAPARRYPVELRKGVAFRSPIDLCVLPYAIPLDFGPVWSLNPNGVAAWIPPLLCVGLAVALGVHWMRRRSTDETDSSRRRRPLWLALAVAAPLLVVAPMAGVFLGSGLPMLAPGPFAGDRDYDVVLTSDGGGDGDAERLRARLDALEVDVTVEDATPDRIALSLRGIRDAEEVLETVLPSQHLELRFAIDMPADVGTGPDVSRVEGEMVTAHVEAASRESLELAFDGWAPPAGHAIGYQCETEPSDYRDSVGAMCMAYLLGPAVITNDDVADARVQVEEFSGMPIVMIEMTDAGGEAFADATGAHVREHLAIVVDDTIVSLPIVQERIAGGRAQITMGMGDFAERTAQAESLAAALRTGALSARWAVQTITER